jgi:hypothetical protein
MIRFPAPISQSSNDTDSSAVKLRDHPLMNYGGTANWPPEWVHTRIMPTRRLTDEVGVPTNTAWYPDNPTRLFLTMNTNNEPYMTALVFTDIAFCRQLRNILQQHIGSTIKEIGDLDLSFTL